MLIIDINGKERRVKSVRRIHREEDYAEVEIIGKLNTWIEWYPWEKFIKDNPHIVGEINGNS